MMYRQAQPQVRAIRVHSAVSIKIGWLQVHRRSLTTSTSRSVGSTIDIRPFFDDRTYFEHAGHDRTRESTGLLGMRHLKEARDLVSAAREAEQRCNRLIDERVLGRTRIGVDHTESHMNDFGERHNHAQPTSLIKHMDTLSDMICTVVDLAECMRTVHPQRAWVTAANDAYAVLGDFINRLNTDPALYHALLGDEVRRRQSRSGSGSGNTQQMRSVTQEEHTVARLFLADFERAGVHLEATRRQQLVGLQNRINEVGHAFATGAGARNGAPGRNKRESVAQLEEMLRLRYNVATLLGKESYAELYLLDKMARTPAQVRHFLERSAERNRPLAERYLLQQRQRPRQSMSLPLQPRYTSVGTVLDTVSWLFNLLYGIRLVPTACAPGECWHPDVRRLDVMQNTGSGLQKLGTVYCDLFARSRNGSSPLGDYDETAPKSPHPAQLTVRCSRRIDDDDPTLAFPHTHYEDLKYLGVSSEKHRVHGQAGHVLVRRQLPVAVLSCDFSSATLSWNEVETVFHEMGHALHSMVAATDFHHVAGTRCQVDFVEIPSILMEYFARHPLVRAKLLGLQSPAEILPAATSTTTASGTSPVDQQHQLFLSFLDQHYHSAAVSHHSFDTDTSYRSVASMHKLQPHATLPADSHPQTTFTHLYGYGSGYYAYAWSRTFAERVYERHFRPRLDAAMASAGDCNFTQDDRVREAGETWLREVLVHGGARDPWDMRWDRVMDGDDELLRELGDSSRSLTGR